MFIPNGDAADELLGSDDAIALVVQAALRAKEEARRIQVDRTGAHDARIFAGGFEMTEASDGTLVPVVYVGSFSGTWHMMEFGSAKNPPFRPLTGGVEAAGIQFRPE